MTNQFYERLYDHDPGELADGFAVESELNAIALGFSKVEQGFTDIQQDVDAKVEQATEINGHPLTGNINLEPKDLGAIRTVNGAAPDENGDLLLNFTSGVQTADRNTNAVFTYDPSGRVTGMTETLPEGLRVSTYTYLNGLLSQSVETYMGRQLTTVFSYDSNGLMTGYSTSEVTV